ncbi:MAG: membrane protein DedA with SNARE-associated domain [Glaciecola sp.]|jgi:membrane protein DedA with SNARE-associated domain
MNKAIERLEEKTKRYDLQLLIILGFILCAITFFAVGLLYGQTFDNVLLAKLLAFLGVVSGSMVWYLLRKLKEVINPA